MHSKCASTAARNGMRKQERKMEDRVPTKHRRGFDRVVLYDVDEMYAPPERPILEVSVIEDTTFLTIRRVDETFKKDTFDTLTQIAVDTESLLGAILASQRVGSENRRKSR